MSTRVRASDEETLARFGYGESLRRALGAVNCFAVSFALMSVTTGIVLTYSLGLANAGPRFVLWWPIVSAGTFFIALTFANLGAKVPVTGYAYQWTSRLVSNHFGWFVGWIALVGWIAGTAGIAYGTSAWVLPLLDISTGGRNVAVGAAIIIVSYTVLNIAGIRVLSLISRGAATVEVLSSLVLAVVLILVWLFGNTGHSASVLTSSGTTGSFTLGAFSVAALTSLWTLQTFEAASEFAEETVDVQRVMPITIIRTWGVGVLTGALLLLGLTLTLPNIDKTLGADVPVLYMLKQALGSNIAPFAWALLLIAIYSCGVATLGAATRLTFSMARDNTLPLSGQLQFIHPTLRSPVTASLVIAAISIVICFWARALLVLSGVAALSWYVVYLAAVFAALWAGRRGTLERLRTEPGVFDLGRWAMPVALIALAWIIAAMAILTLPEGNRVNAKYTGGALLVGFVWWAVWLRRSIAAGKSGVPNQLAAAHVTASPGGPAEKGPLEQPSPGL